MSMELRSRVPVRQSPLLSARLLIAACSLLFLIIPATAQELNGTLKKIKDTGAITLAFRESAIPFSYYDSQQKAVGYAQDYANAVVEAVKKELKLTSLKVNYIPVTPQNRMSLVQNGTVDLECGSTTNNLERQKQVAFSNTFFVIGTRLLTKKTSGIKDFPDLKGKTVVTNAGSTSEVLLRKMNVEKNMNMSVIAARDHAESFLNLETGRAVAFMMDDVLLYGNRMTAKHPEDWVEAYGCMLRREDPQFKQFVDKVFAKLMTSAEGQRIYKRWMQSPIPPKGLNMEFPMTKEVAEVLKHPNDKALQ